ncbi:alpha/beta fold hydrolase [Nonomuraea sp. NPDC050536]|uniref:alpha/beta fold hydrolase n=1 Tax=Nonomuraea sp. NPDC050536 TaxID=3364366 RepID=UPI0037C61CC7
MIVTHHVISKDDTTIGYRRLGRGPALIILHGAMSAGHSHLQLAKALSDRYTCYLPDRRGRGASGPSGLRYGVQREVEDLSALMEASGARMVLGVSSGAIITLKTALVRPELDKAVIFEPPLSVNGSNDPGWLPLFDARIASGDISGALVMGMKRTQMGPPLLNAMPEWLLRPMTNAMMKRQDADSQPGEPTFRQLAPTLHNDAWIVQETADDLAGFAAVEAEVLLLGGSKSPAYLKQALTALEGVLPHACRVELPGLGHGATGPTDQGGDPGAVAKELHAFLGI